MVVYDVDMNYNNMKIDSSVGWLYIVLILFLVVGIILGCIYIVRREDNLGKFLIIISVVVIVILIFMSLFFVSLFF